MAGVDTSIYGQIAPPADPFAVPNKLLQLQQGQLQNQIAQRSLGGQQALQDALSQPGAIDDKGQINVPMVRNALINTPGAALIPDAVAKGQGITTNDIANEGSRYDLNNKQFSTVGATIGAGLQANPNYGAKDALRDINGLVERHIISPQQGASVQHDLPRDNAGAKTWLAKTFIRTLPNSGAGAGVPGGVASDGSNISVTPGQFITQSVGAGDTSAPPPAAGGPAPAPAPVASKPRMGVVTSLPPGQAEAANVGAQSAAGQAAAFEKQANAAVDNKATLANMQDQLAKVATGPYADRINNAKAGFNELVDASGLPLPQFDKDKIAALDEFRKNGQILANQQFATLGGTGTDAQLSAAVHSNPGTFMSNLSNKQIMQMLQGNQDAIEAKATAWRQYQAAHGGANSPQFNFNTFSEDFNRNFSPRAFQFVHMSPKERREFINSIGGEGTPDKPNPKYQQLNEAMNTAIQRGWINPPGAAK